MDRITDKNFLQSMSNLVRAIRTVLTCSNMIIMCLVLLSLNNGIILAFQALDQKKLGLFFYNFLIIIPELMYFMATYYGFFGSFRCSGRYLKRYIIYSMITIGLLFIFAIYWYVLGEEANQVQFGRRRFKENLDDYKNSDDNCTKSTVGYRRLDRFMSDYKCCDWDKDNSISISINKTAWSQCALKSFNSCSGNSSVSYCVDKLNRVIWISYSHFLLYVSVFFLFILNLFSVYLRREIIAHRIRSKEHKTYTTVF